MPIKTREHNGKTQYKWGDKGAWFASRRQAESQAAAAYAHGYVGDERPLLDWPVDDEGYFAVPKKKLTPEEEVKAHQARMSAVIMAQYADRTCGNPFTLDPTGAYLCGGRIDGKSSPCNKFLILNNECVIREKKTIAEPCFSSCGFWDKARDGDPEIVRADSTRYKDEQLRFGTTQNPLGFSCQRCEYGQGVLPIPDSEGRGRWCKYHGFPAEDAACCADNEPAKIGMDSTLRTYDKDGRMRISRSHISKACVNPYYGREIPHSERLGLNPNQVYYLLRDPKELAKAAPSFTMLPILSKHTPIDIYWDMVKRKDYIIGSIGSNVEFLDPYLDADVCIWDVDAIAGIETDQVREFSCGYKYEPIMTTGNYNGQKYDGIMTQIEGNHLVLVESGRAGSDVLAADSKLETEPMKRTKLGNALIVAIGTAFPKVRIAQDSELEKALGTATRATFTSEQRSAASTMILAMDKEIDGKQVKAVMDALTDIDDPEPTKKTNKEMESAEDEKEPDEDDEEEMKKKSAKDKKGAKDKKEDEDEPVTKTAMDSQITALRNQYREADEAKRAVRAIVGDVIAMDSAADIYGFALDQMKVDRTGVEGVPALRALFNVAKDRQISVPTVAMDSASTLQRFPQLSRIKLT